MTGDSASSIDGDMFEAGPEAAWRRLIEHCAACGCCVPDELCALGGTLAAAWRRAVNNRRHGR